MADKFDQERREFIRVPCTVFVKYKFLCPERKDAALDKIYEGTSNNLSGGGILFAGPMPDKSWIPDLLTHRIVVGVHLMVPNMFEPVKALTRLAWIEPIDEKQHLYSMGLTFKEIPTAERDRILTYIVQSKLPL